MTLWRISKEIRAFYKRAEQKVIKNFMENAIKWTYPESSKQSLCIYENANRKSSRNFTENGSEAANVYLHRTENFMP